MAQIVRQTAVWTGTPGLPGYSQFYHDVPNGVAADAQQGHNAVRGFFNTLSSLIPADITITVDPIYAVIDEATGEITVVQSVTTPSQAVAGAYVSNWAGQVGALVEWRTGSYIDGRQLRGRTYLVPLGNVSDDDGTLPTGTLALVNDAIPWIVGQDPGFVVWHRPKPLEAGTGVAIASGLVRDHAAVLNSRRR